MFTTSQLEMMTLEPTQQMLPDPRVLLRFVRTELPVAFFCWVWKWMPAKEICFRLISNWWYLRLLSLIFCTGRCIQECLQKQDRFGICFKQRSIRRILIFFLNKSRSFLFSLLWKTWWGIHFILHDRSSAHRTLRSTPLLLVAAPCYRKQPWSLPWTASVVWELFSTKVEVC